MESEKISWDLDALKNFNEALDHIANDSIINSEKVKNDFFKKINGLIRYPERYSPDKYKRKNDGSFRAFELHHYRVSYHIGFDIRIISIRHTSRKPRYY